MPDKQQQSTTTTSTTQSTSTEQTTTQEFGSNEQNAQQLQTGSGTEVSAPTTEEAVLAAARACPGVAELEGREKKADPRLLEYVTRFEAMTPGWTEEAQALWVEFLAASKDIAKETGDTSGGEVRGLYDGPFTDLMNGWIAANESSGMELKQQAELAHMYRKVLRELSRDLMTDQNAVKVLRARDMIKHGSPFGPSFASLFEKKGGAQDADGAYRGIIGSSTSHDQAASQSANPSQSSTGSGGGGSGGFIKSKL